MKSKPKKPHKRALPIVLSKSLRKKAKAAEQRAAEAFANVPRITNETVAEHREEVLGSARKYIYPLQHSRHRVVRISVVLFIIVIVGFFGYCGAALYKFQSTSTFIYGVTQVIPFPVAKAGPSWVSYQSYLFELRRNMHYYQTQQQADFSSKTGKQQLQHLKQEAMSQVIENAYVKQLAQKNHISITPQEVSNEVSVLQSENKLGSNTQVLDEVLNQFWGWNENDFKTELSSQLLQQAVVAKLDIKTKALADTIEKQLANGASFANLALEYSDDSTTKATGGAYPDTITPNDPTLDPAVLHTLYTLRVGAYSQVVNTSYGLEILKLIARTNNSLQAAHIELNYANIATFVQPIEQKHKPHYYIAL